MTRLDIATRGPEFEPTLGPFAERYRAGVPQVLWTRLVADLETPVSVMLKLGDGQPMSCLLESVEGGAVRGRYSILGMNPDLIWKVEGGRALLNRRAGADPDGPFEDAGLSPLAALRALLAESRIKLPEDAPPMAAGVFGYMGYDMVRLMEELPPANRDALGLPELLAAQRLAAAIPAGTPAPSEPAARSRPAAPAPA